MCSIHMTECRCQLTMYSTDVRVFVYIWVYLFSFNFVSLFIQTRTIAYMCTISVLPSQFVWERYLSQRLWYTSTSVILLSLWDGLVNFLRTFLTYFFSFVWRFDFLVEVLCDPFIVDNVYQLVLFESFRTENMYKKLISCTVLLSCVANSYAFKFRK